MGRLHPALFRVLPMPFIVGTRLHALATGNHGAEYTTDLAVTPQTLHLFSPEMS